MVRRTLVVGLVLALGACSGTRYVQARDRAPIREEEVWVRVPAVGGRGEVRIASGGVRRVMTSTGAQVDALLVRMSVRNDNSLRPWTLDTRQQLMALPAGVRTPPLGFDTDAGPVVSVACGERRVVELYYVLPPAGLDTLPTFELLWQVDTGDQLVSRSTEFERVASGFVPERSVVALRDAPVMISLR